MRTKERNAIGETCIRSSVFVPNVRILKLSGSYSKVTFPEEPSAEIALTMEVKQPPCSHIMRRNTREN